MRGLYVHVPFCRLKCPYCGFYSETNFDKDIVTKYFKACLETVDAAKNNQFDTIYYGGGTPSSVTGGILEDFTDKLLSRINFSGLEFTVEANPESVSKDFTDFVKNFPISRVSLGVQSLNDDTLKKLGRIHNSKQALQACNKILDCNVSLNTDIIFDIPETDQKAVFETLKVLTSFGHDHISAYSYSSDDRGYMAGFDSDFTEYDHVENYLEERYFKKYEISNFAKEDKESKHNIIYWTGDEYLGIGASAHSMIYSDSGLKQRYSFPENIHQYIANPQTYSFFEELNEETAFKETLIFGLRMKKGIDVGNIEKRFGKMPLNLLNNIEKYIDLGMLQWNGEHLQTTKRGALILDSLSCCLWE